MGFLSILFIESPKEFNMVINEEIKCKDVYVLLVDKETNLLKEVKCKGYRKEPTYWWDSDCQVLKEFLTKFGSMELLPVTTQKIIAFKWLHLSKSPTLELQKNSLFTKEELEFMRGCFKKYALTTQKKE